MTRTEAALVLKPHTNLLVNAYFRWQDEKKYENIDDYKNVLIDVTHLDIIKMTKRPFGIKIKCSDGGLYVYVERIYNNLKLRAKFIEI